MIKIKSVVKKAFELLVFGNNSIGLAFLIAGSFFQMLRQTNTNSTMRPIIPIIIMAKNRVMLDDVGDFGLLPVELPGKLAVELPVELPILFVEVSVGLVSEQSTRM